MEILVKSIGSTTVLLTGICSALLIAGNVRAESASMPAPPEHCQAVDRVQMLQNRLEALKAKLDLNDSQLSAWNAWTSKVIDDVKEFDKEAGNMPHGWMDAQQADLPTPERMTKQEERLRNRINWMQKRLTRLEAARKNTATFYSELSKDQKTIFDLFWNRDFLERHHPMGNFDHNYGWGMHERKGFGGQ